MTWSIVARDEKTGRFAIAVTTCAFAVGARVPHGAGRIGAIASQAFANSFYGIDGMDLLRDGLKPEEAMNILIARDAGSAHRQVHMIDSDGRIAAFTGAACIPWCGNVRAQNVSVAGNMLANRAVVKNTLDAYLANAALDLDDRLLTALEAGQAAGGDMRGKQSAAIRIWETEVFPSFDVRVDDHAEPLVEMRRLWRVAHQRYVPFQKASATRANPAGINDRETLDKLCADYAADWNARHIKV